MLFRETYDNVVNGRKTCTTRTPAYKWFKWYSKKIGKMLIAESGDGRTHPIIITDVIKTCLQTVKKRYFKEEGFDSPEEYESVWFKLHGNFHPKEKVCVIFFVLTKLTTEADKKNFVKLLSPRKPRNVNTHDTKPEILFREIYNSAKQECGLQINRFVSNKPFITKFREWPLVPDFTDLDLPLICEVDGYRWHEGKGKKKMLKDEAKNQCYLGEGKYVFRVTDRAIYKSSEMVKYELVTFLNVILNEQGRTPKIRKFDVA